MKVHVATCGSFEVLRGVRVDVAPGDSLATVRARLVAECGAALPTDFAFLRRKAGKHAYTVDESALPERRKVRKVRKVRKHPRRVRDVQGRMKRVARADETQRTVAECLPAWRGQWEWHAAVADGAPHTCYTRGSDECKARVPRYARAGGYGPVPDTLRHRTRRAPAAAWRGARVHAGRVLVLVIVPRSAARSAAAALRECIEQGDAAGVAGVLQRAPNAPFLANHVNALHVPMLHDAARVGRADVVAALLRGGAVAHAADWHGQTALSVAAVRGHDDVARVLLDACARLLHLADHMQRQPVHLALYYRRMHTACMLARHGADLAACDGLGNHAGALYDCVATPWPRAVRDGDIDALRAYLDSPFVKHAKRALLRRHNHILHAAIAGGHAPMVRFLLELGASAHAPDWTGTAPLHVACRAGALDIVEMLLACDGVDANVRNHTGNTPLHVGIAHLGIVQCLLAAGALPNMTNDDGNAPLHIAAHTGNEAALHMLLRSGADANLLGWVGEHSGPRRQRRAERARKLLAPAIVAHEEATRVRLAQEAKERRRSRREARKRQRARARKEEERRRLRRERKRQRMSAQEWEEAESRRLQREAQHRERAERDARKRKKEKRAKKVIEGAGSSSRRSGSRSRASNHAGPSAPRRHAWILPRAYVPALRGRSPLEAAVCGGHIECVRALLDSGASTALLDQFARSCVTMACEHGHRTIATLLMERGASALPWAGKAVEARRISMQPQQEHLQAGAPHDESDPCRAFAQRLRQASMVESPLLAAARCNNAPLVAWLCEHPQASEALSDEWAESAQRALTHALRRGFVAVAHELVRHGVVCTWRSAPYTLLRHAAVQGDVESVRALVSAGGVGADAAGDALTAALDAAPAYEWQCPKPRALMYEHVCTVLLDMFGAAAVRNPAHFAMVCIRKRMVRVRAYAARCGVPHVKAAAVLMRANPPPLRTLDVRSRVDMHDAIVAWDIDAVQRNLQAGACIDMNQRMNTLGHTLLHTAVAARKLASVKWLLIMGADASHADWRGATPLHLAAQRGLLKTMSLLLQRSDASLVDITDDAGRSALHVALVHGQRRAAEMLLNAGANPNLVDRAGCAPLHMVAGRAEALAMLHALVARGADASLFLSAADAAAMEQRISARRWGARAVRRAACMSAARAARRWSSRASRRAGAWAYRAAALAHGRSPLHVAVACGNLEGARALLDAGADAAYVDAEGRTLVAVAMEHNLPDMANLLVERGAPLDAPATAHAAAIADGTALGVPKVKFARKFHALAAAVEEKAQRVAKWEHKLARRVRRYKRTCRAQRHPPSSQVLVDAGERAGLRMEQAEINSCAPMVSDTTGLHLFVAQRGPVRWFELGARKYEDKKKGKKGKKKRQGAPQPPRMSKRQRKLANDLKNKKKKKKKKNKRKVHGATLRTATAAKSTSIAEFYRTRQERVQQQGIAVVAARRNVEVGQRALVVRRAKAEAWLRTHMHRIEACVLDLEATPAAKPLLTLLSALDAALGVVSAPTPALVAAHTRCVALCGAMYRAREGMVREMAVLAVRGNCSWGLEMAVERGAALRMALVVAADARKDAMVLRLLSAGMAAPLPVSALLYGARTHNARLCMQVLGPNVEVKRSELARAMHLAVRGGQCMEEAVLRMLQLAGMEDAVSSCMGDNGEIMYTPLYVRAAEHALWRVVEAVLTSEVGREHADVNAHVPERGESLLYLAARDAHADMVALLLSRGADVNPCAMRAPLDAALCAGAVDIAATLHVHGARLSHGAAVHGLLRSALREHPLAARLYEHMAHTDWVLSRAARHGDTAVVQLLLDAGCSANKAREVRESAVLARKDFAAPSTELYKGMTVQGWLSRVARLSVRLRVSGRREKAIVRKEMAALCEPCMPHVVSFMGASIEAHRAIRWRHDTLSMQAVGKLRRNRQLLFHLQRLLAPILKKPSRMAWVEHRERRRHLRTLRVLMGPQHKKMGWDAQVVEWGRYVVKSRKRVAKCIRRSVNAGVRFGGDVYEPPLVAAARGGHVDVVHALLDHANHADVLVRDACGVSAVQAAFAAGHIPIAAELLQRGGHDVLPLGGPHVQLTVPCTPLTMHAWKGSDAEVSAELHRLGDDVSGEDVVCAMVAALSTHPCVSDARVATGRSPAAARAAAAESDEDEFVVVGGPEPVAVVRTLADALVRVGSFSPIPQRLCDEMMLMCAERGLFDVILKLMWVVSWDKAYRRGGRGWRCVAWHAALAGHHAVVWSGVQATPTECVLAAFLGDHVSLMGALLMVNRELPPARMAQLLPWLQWQKEHVYACVESEPLQALVLLRTAVRSRSPHDLALQLTRGGHVALLKVMAQTGSLPAELTELSTPEVHSVKRGKALSRKRMRRMEQRLCARRAALVKSSESTIAVAVADAARQRHELLATSDDSYRMPDEAWRRRMAAARKLPVYKQLKAIKAERVKTRGAELRRAARESASVFSARNTSYERAHTRMRDAARPMVAALSDLARQVGRTIPTTKGAAKAQGMLSTATLRRLSAKQRKERNRKAKTAETLATATAEMPCVVWSRKTAALVREGAALARSLGVQLGHTRLGKRARSVAKRLARAQAHMVVATSRAVRVSDVLHAVAKRGDEAALRFWLASRHVTSAHIEVAHSRGWHTLAQLMFSAPSIETGTVPLQLARGLRVDTTPLVYGAYVGDAAAVASAAPRADDAERRTAMRALVLGGASGDCGEGLRALLACGTAVDGALWRELMGHASKHMLVRVQCALLAVRPPNEMLLHAWTLRAARADAVELVLALDNTSEVRGVLHEAAKAGAARVVAELVRTAHSVDEPDAWGFAPLHYVCERGDFALAAVLANRAALQARTVNMGRSALMLAARAGSVSTCELLLAHSRDKAVLHERSADGLSPLLEAARKGHADVCRLLFASGLRADATADAEALHHACRHGMAWLVRELVQVHGVRRDVRDCRGLLAVHWALAMHCDADVVALVQPDAAERVDVASACADSHARAALMRLPLRGPPFASGLHPHYYEAYDPVPRTQRRAVQRTPTDVLELVGFFNPERVFRTMLSSASKQCFAHMLQRWHYALGCPIGMTREQHVFLDVSSLDFGALRAPLHHYMDALVCALGHGGVLAEVERALELVYQWTDALGTGEHSRVNDFVVREIPRIQLRHRACGLGTAGGALRVLCSNVVRSESGGEFIFERGAEGATSALRTESVRVEHGPGVEGVGVHFAVAGGGSRAAPLVVQCSANGGETWTTVRTVAPVADGDAARWRFVHVVVPHATLDTRAQGFAMVRMVCRGAPWRVRELWVGAHVGVHVADGTLVVPFDGFDARDSLLSVSADKLARALLRHVHARPDGLHAMCGLAEELRHSVRTQLDVFAARLHEQGFRGTTVEADERVAALQPASRLCSRGGLTTSELVRCHVLSRMDDVLLADVDDLLHKVSGALARSEVALLHAELERVVLCPGEEGQTAWGEAPGGGLELRYVFDALPRHSVVEASEAMAAAPPAAVGARASTDAAGFWGSNLPRSAGDAAERGNAMPVVDGVRRPEAADVIAALLRVLPLRASFAEHVARAADAAAARVHERAARAATQLRMVMSVPQAVLARRLGRAVERDAMGELRHLLKHLPDAKKDKGRWRPAVCVDTAAALLAVQHSVAPGHARALAEQRVLSALQRAVRGVETAFGGLRLSYRKAVLVPLLRRVRAVHVGVRVGRFRACEVALRDGDGVLVVRVASGGPRAGVTAMAREVERVLVEAVGDALLAAPKRVYRDLHSAVSSGVQGLRVHHKHRWHGVVDKKKKEEKEEEKEEEEVQSGAVADDGGMPSATPAMIVP